MPPQAGSVVKKVSGEVRWPEQGILSLDPGVEEWRSLTAEIEKFLGDQLASLGSGSTLSSNDESMPMGDAGAVQDLGAYLSALFDSGFDTAHPAFMAYIPGGGLVTSALADWVVKTMNRYGTARFASPRLVDLENRVIRTFADWVGYGERAAGVLTTGGSLANFTALVTARRAMLPEDFLNGVIYCSDQTHHSIMKSANLAGFSKRNLRVLKSDDGFRMQPQILERAIAEDRAAGMTPFLVVGSAGTTNTGSIDPLPALADICSRDNLWFHVDGAYGGAFVITERGRARLAGIERADSITLDPHKGLFLPYGTGSILVKDRDALIEAHELRGEYMPDVDDEQAHLDPLSLSVELSREHRGLKIALPLMLHGIDAFVAELDEKLDLAQYAHQQLIEISELDVLNVPQLSTVVFRLRAAPEDRERLNRALCENVLAGGRVYLSPTILSGDFALRISILSHRTHRNEVEQAIAELKRGIAEVLQEV